MTTVPLISVIVLNYNGLRHLDDCFTSLAALDHPADRVELIFVDNASSDGSVDYMRRAFPRVRIVANDTNVGYSGGNNIGVQHAQGDYVVFLNNDMRVAPSFLTHLIGAIRSGPDVRCAGAKIVNWDGTAIDFAAAGAHFAGYAYQLGYGEPVASDRHTEIVPLLFACGGAMMIDRQVFVDAGGFDDDYFMFYEDLDLGWRLWLLGYEVMFAPDALVYHRHHGSADSVAAFRKQVLYKRNALCTVLKNYDDRNLGRVLPAVLLGTIDGVVASASRQGRLPLAEFKLPATAAATGAPITLDRLEASTLVAIHDVVQSLPRVMAKRRAVQRKRQRSDEQVAELFRRPFRHWPDVDPDVQYRVTNEFDVQDLFEGIPRRVLVISSDILPYPGLPTVGSGLRAWGLGQGLAARGHEVIFSMPKAALAGREALVPPEVRRLAWETFTLGEVARSADPDVIVVCNWPVMALLPTEWLGLPVVLDQHGPHLMEREYQRAGDPAENIEHKLVALRKADFFTCAGHKQWTYFQQWLERAGWTAEERQDRSAVIPVSLSPELPVHRPSDGLTFVYGGVFLPWQDPTLALSTLVETLERAGRGHLLFYGGKHPVYPVDTGIFDELLDRLQKSDRVVAPGMVPHDELIAQYTRSHVAIDLMRRNPERELAFTTRTVEYLWCGLPVIYNDYGELAEYIRDFNAGWTVDPEDRAALARVLAEIIDHPEVIAERSAGAQRLVRERLAWNTTIAPLDHFVRHPAMRYHEKPTVAEVVASPTSMRHLLRRAWGVYRREGPVSAWRKGSRFIRRYVTSASAPAAPTSPKPARERFQKYLVGDGIEIGALHNPMPVDKSRARVRYVDRMSLEEQRRHYPELGGHHMFEPDILSNADDLPTVADSSLDFVIANHLLEHVPDPIGALKEWYRILRPGGTLFLALPDKRVTFDKDRPRTPLAHLIADHEDRGAASRLAHYEEYARLVDKKEGDEFPRHVADMLARNYSIHFHVWVQEDIAELLAYVRDQGAMPWVIRDQAKTAASDEFIFVLQKPR